MTGRLHDAVQGCMEVYGAACLHHGVVIWLLLRRPSQAPTLQNLRGGRKKKKRKQQGWGWFGIWRTRRGRPSVCPLPVPPVPNRPHSIHTNNWCMCGRGEGSAGLAARGVWPRQGVSWWHAVPRAHTKNILGIYLAHVTCCARRHHHRETGLPMLPCSISRGCAMRVSAGRTPLCLLLATYL